MEVTSEDELMAFGKDKLEFFHWSFKEVYKIKTAT